jgi:hypothetical protein
VPRDRLGNAWDRLRTLGRGDASLEAGADGYILKEAAPEEFFEAIHSVLQAVAPGFEFKGFELAPKDWSPAD